VVVVLKAVSLLFARMRVVAGSTILRRPVHRLPTQPFREYSLTLLDGSLDWQRRLG